MVLCNKKRKNRYEHSFSKEREMHINYLRFIPTIHTQTHLNRRRKGMEPIITMPIKQMLDKETKKWEKRKPNKSHFDFGDLTKVRA